MTTVDVYINSVAGDQSISLHNGLSGPATTLFHAVLDACQAGSARGEWSGSHARVTLTGGVLRAMLADIGGLEQQVYHQPGDDQRLDCFRSTIEDDAQYAIEAIEF